MTSTRVPDGQQTGQLLVRIHLRSLICASTPVKEENAGVSYLSDEMETAVALQVGLYGAPGAD